MIQVLQLVIDAVSLGSLYALAALGIGLIFGVLRLINFAHGDFITIGAYALIVPSLDVVAIRFIGGWPWPFLITAVVGVVVVVALISEIVVFRPLRDANPATLMVGSFALSFIIQHVLLMLYGSRPKSVGLWSELNLPVDILGLRVPQLQIIVILATAALLGALVIFLKRTSFGVEMRAAAENFRMARLLGVRANMVIALAFGISGLLAAVIALLFITQTGVLSLQLGLPLMLYAFIATVIGGMGSLIGAVVGGFMVGAFSVVLQAVLPVELRSYRDAFVFALVILILLWRPQGLVPVRAVEERV